MRLRILSWMVLLAATLFAGTDTLIVHQWLMREPIPVALPAFSAERGEDTTRALLENEYLDLTIWYPRLPAVAGKEQTIRRVCATEDTVWLPESDGYRIVYLQGYVRTPLYRKLTVSVTGNAPLEVYWDGKSRTQLKPEKSWTSRTVTVVGEPGIHRLTVKVLLQPQARAGIRVALSPVDTTISVMLSPQLRMDIHHLLDTPTISGIAVDPTGTYAAVGIRQVEPESGKYRVGYRIYRIKDRALVYEIPAHAGISNLQWAPDGVRFTYIKKENERGTIYAVNVTTGEVRALLKNIEHLSGHAWAPVGNRLYYTVEEQLKSSPLAKHLKTPRDRWPWFRKTATIFEYDVSSGILRRITSGVLSTQWAAFSTDGRTLYVTRQADDFEHRPYIATYLVRIQLQTLKADTLFKSGWLTKVIPAPDGKQLLLLGGPSLFGKLGWNLPEGMIPNEFDTQAYLYDLRTGKAECISREFNPDIQDAAWTADGKTIYFRVIRGEYVKLYRYNVRKKQYSEIPTAVDVVNDVQWDRRGRIAVYWGSSVTTPPQAYVLKGTRSRLLTAPAAADFQWVQFGKVEKWDFKNADGVTIEGRVYYPPDFDPQKKYPCIVYYYGGVNTTVRSFGGRYPKNLFAAHDYVVYVLQPSGATGYGQEFSAWHVNDWGKRVSEEIIQGVRQFLAAHPFVDANRVGAIGASYGGFMTMLLMTKTDLFATGIAHAGISSISSYWGEGFWGYIYSAYSAAGSFPWNRKDIFVERSPLFHADKVKTPLLLLHGTADTNVPKGETEQFWVALKLLGTPVEYVAIPGQDHHIVNYKKRIQWQKTILAWFDRWLKGQPQWWEALYPPLLSAPDNGK